MKRKRFFGILMSCLMMVVMVSCNGNAGAMSDDDGMIYSVDDTQPVILEEGVQTLEEETDAGMFACDEDFVLLGDGVCLAHGKQLYSLMDVIPIENSSKYNVGIPRYEKAAVVYWGLDYTFLSSNDFEPVVAERSDTIRSYGDSEITLCPVEFQKYSIMALKGDTVLTYYNEYGEQGMSLIGFEVSIYDVANGTQCDIGGDFERGKAYMLKFGPRDGDQFEEETMIADKRVYEKSGDNITINGKAKKDYYEYSLADIPSGTYVVITSDDSRGRGIFTIE